MIENGSRNKPQNVINFLYRLLICAIYDFFSFQLLLQLAIALVLLFCLIFSSPHNTKTKSNLNLLKIEEKMLPGCVELDRCCSSERDRKNDELNEIFFNLLWPCL